MCILYWRDSDEKPVTLKEAGFSKFGKYVQYISKIIVLTYVHIYKYIRNAYKL